MRIACVVEGHGEVPSVPLLIRRIAQATLPGVYLDIPHPIRVHRYRFVRREEEFNRVVRLASAKAGSRGAVVVLLDVNDDCAKTAAEEIRNRILEVVGERTLAVVFAVREYEAWFLAAASSVAGKRGLPALLADHENPEDVRGAKGWLSAQMPPGRPYRETIDQPALTAEFDLDLARERSRSFSKFYREIEKIVRTLETGGHGG